MARSIRIQFAGAFYHVMARGNRREAIFTDDTDCLLFLDTLAEACGKTGWRVHAWVLMGNHYHLLIETPQPNLVGGMTWLQNAYTRRFNTRHRAWGRLFGDRYKAVLVQSAEGDYYGSLLDYIHLNPVRARLVGPGSAAAGSGVRDYPWSSVAMGYGDPPSKRPAWLAAGDGLAAFGCKDTPSGRAAFADRLDARAAAEECERCGKAEAVGDGRFSDISRGWYWGARDFAERMLERYGRGSRQRTSRNYRAGGLDRDHSETEAEALAAEGMIALGINADQLGKTPGADPRKASIALAIKRRTSVRHSWIADRLRMKSPANVSQQVSLFKAKLAAGEVAMPIRKWLKKLDIVA